LLPLFLEKKVSTFMLPGHLNPGVPSFHWTYKMTWKIDRRQNLISRELQFEPNPMTNKYPYDLTS
ncbi:DUF1564 family protein, partial [Leptospira interrogans]|uniref:DUF1564 family protein n=1 Tax=Leptospira interrogans TaxID=173 RepID=UPI000513BFCB